MLFDGRIIAGITVFVAVAKAGSYPRAAEQVGLSRSGVGKAISRLEERMDMRLFDRNNRALKLTDEGRAFLEEVAPLLDQLGQAATPSRGGDVRGRLRVSTDAAFGPSLLIPALPKFIATYPRLKIDVVVRDRIDNLVVEGIDVAIRFGEPDARGLDKRLVLLSRMLTCASRAYVERMGTPTRPEDIGSGHTCVRLLDDGTGRPRAWDFENHSGQRVTIAPDCGLTVNDAPSLVAAALSDLGIVRLFDFVAEEHQRSGKLVEILPEWNQRQWPAYLYTAPDIHPTHAIKAFSAFACSHPFFQPDRQNLQD